MFLSWLLLPDRREKRVVAVDSLSRDRQFQDGDSRGGVLRAPGSPSECVHVDQWFLRGDDFVPTPGGRLAAAKDIFYCHNLG